MAERQPRPLGRDGPMVGAIGLGCMALSGLYGPTDEDAAIATINECLDAGITLLDTADFYGSGHNEMLIARATAGRRREDFQLSVKFGGLRGPDGQLDGNDNRPAAMRNFLAYSLRRLGTDYLDVYRPARLDPAVPIEDTIGAIAEQVRAGRVRYIGLSEVGAHTIRRAAAVHPISDVQLEYSVFSRGIEKSILPTCRELGIGITAYGVLSRGLISDRTDLASDPGDTRRHSPRFQDGNLARNRELVALLRPIAARHGLTVAQLAIAWVASRGEDILPVIGMTQPPRVAEALAAAQVFLDAADIRDIEAAVPPGGAAGERYGPAAFALLDSER